MFTNTSIMVWKMSLQFNLLFWKLVPHLARGLHWTMIRHYVKNKSWQNSAAVISSSCGEAAGVLVPVKRAVDTPRSFVLQVRIHRQEDPRADIRCIRMYCWVYWTGWSSSPICGKSHPRIRISRRSWCPSPTRTNHSVIWPRSLLWRTQSSSSVWDCYRSSSFKELCSLTCPGLGKKFLWSQIRFFFASGSQPSWVLKNSQRSVRRLARPCPRSASPEPIWFGPRWSKSGLLPFKVTVLFYFV